METNTSTNCSVSATQFSDFTQFRRFLNVLFDLKDKFEYSDRQDILDMIRRRHELKEFDEIISARQFLDQWFTLMKLLNIQSRQFKTQIILSFQSLSEKPEIVQYFGDFPTYAGEQLDKLEQCENRLVDYMKTVKLTKCQKLFVQYKLQQVQNKINSKKMIPPVTTKSELVAVDFFMAMNPNIPSNDVFKKFSLLYTAHRQMYSYMEQHQQQLKSVFVKKPETNDAVTQTTFDNYPRRLPKQHFDKWTYGRSQNNDHRSNSNRHHHPYDRHLASRK